ncbi:MAG: SWIM zinc finger family protein, partial [Rubrobacter sp.]
MDRDALLDLAGERYFERGDGYHRGGHVRSLVEHDGVIVAKVVGTEEYRVRLWAEDGLAYSCDCPLGVDGAFCKHCVAVGLAWLEGGFSDEAPGDAVTMDDVQSYLGVQDKDVLVRLIMEQAM